MATVAAITPELGAGFGAIHAETFSDDEAQAFAELVAQYRRPIDRSAPAVCIDGRELAEGESPLELGPHIAGGAMTLLVGAEAANHSYTGSGLLDYAKSHGFNLAAHCDDNNKTAGFANGTGCGANDKLPAIGRIYRENKTAADAVVAQLMGDDFDPAIAAAVALPEPGENDWDKNFLRNAVGEDKVENLHDDNEGVHGHKEQMVIFNTTANTTIDRDALVRETGKQVFTVDLWYIKELARTLATGPNAAQQAKEMEHAMVAYQVGTYLALCDGSHRAAVLA